MAFVQQPFLALGPVDIAAAATGSAFQTAAIPCLGASQVSVCLDAGSVRTVTGFPTAASATVPVSSSLLIASGATTAGAVVTSTSITGAQTVINVTGDSHTGASLTINAPWVAMTSTAGLVVGQGITCAGKIPANATIKLIDSGTVITMDRMAIASGGAQTVIGSRITLSAVANAGTGVAETLTLSGPQVSACAAVTFSNDGVNFTTPDALIGTATVVNFVAAITQDLNMGGGQFFTVSLANAVTGALVGLPVRYCRFSWTAGTRALHNVTASAWMFGPNHVQTY